MSLAMQEYKQFAQRIGLIGATNLFMNLSGLILLPILTKTMPIDEYGTYVQITVTIGLVPAVVMLGLPYSMVRFLASVKDRGDIQEGFYSIAAITTVTAGCTSLAFYFLADPIAETLFDGQVMVTKIFAAVIFLECTNILQFNYFRTYQQIKRYSLLTLLKSCLQLALVSALVFTNNGIIGAIIGLLVADLTLTLIMGVVIASEISVAIPKFNDVRKYLSFGLPTVPGNLSSWVVNSSDRYIIALFLGTAFVGYYSPGYTLGNVVSIYVAPLAFLLPAILSKCYDENNMETVKTVLYYSNKYFLMLSIPSFVGLSLLSKPLLGILSTPEIAQQGYMVVFFTSLGAIFYGIRSIDSQILVLEKKTMITGKLWILSGFINMFLNVFMVPIFGIIGAAASTLFTYGIAYIVLGNISKKYIKLDTNWKIIFKIFIASSVIAVIILYTNPIKLLEILLTVVICIIVYAIILIMLKVISKTELIFFKQIIGVKKKETIAKD